jgi:hypothetical protein
VRRLLGSGYLSRGATLGLPFLLPVLWRHWSRLDPMHPEWAAAADDEDAADFLRAWSTTRFRESPW